MTENLYKQWTESLQDIGLKPIPDDTCCRLLAILYVFGGNSEFFTHHPKLLIDIKYAQTRLNLEGGKTPNAELIPFLQEYIKDLESAVEAAPYKANGSYVYEKDLKSWAIDFMKRRYNIKLI